MRLRLGRAGLILGLLMVPSVALAHDVASDGALTITLHIEPDDSPSAGTPQTLELFYAVSSGSFDLANCDCQMSIKDPSGAATTSPLVYAKANEGTLPITFKQAGSHTLVATGKPKSGATFGEFRINYVVDVAADPAKAAGQQRTFTNVLIGGGIVIVLLAVVGVGWFVLRNRNQTSLPKNLSE